MYFYVQCACVISWSFSLNNDGFLVVARAGSDSVLPGPGTSRRPPTGVNVTRSRGRMGMNYRCRRRDLSRNG